MEFLLEFMVHFQSIAHPHFLTFLGFLFRNQGFTRIISF